jgi:hypothetical protein
MRGCYDNVSKKEWKEMWEQRYSTQSHKKETKLEKIRWILGI